MNELEIAKVGGSVERSSPAADAARLDVSQRQLQQARVNPEQDKQRVGEQEEVATPGMAEEVASDLGKLVQGLHRELQFTVDEDSGQPVIKVIDRQTDEVVRQIPSEELVKLRSRLEEAAGVLFRDSA